MLDWTRNIIGRKPSDKRPRSRKRLTFDTMPRLVYAIGDVHGRLDLLLNIEAQIAADVAAHNHWALIIMLGDYIDRGPDSSAILDHLLAPSPPNTKRLCLCGNHEEAMLTFLHKPRTNDIWLDFGGRETLYSYGLGVEDLKSTAHGQRDLAHKVASLVPEEHVEFLRTLPILATFPPFLFVHAGIRPGVPLKAQKDRDLLTIRNDFLNQSLDSELTVIHGHTPTSTPFISPSRINIDTGAYMTGHLTVAKFMDGDLVGFLTT